MKPKYDKEDLAKMVMEGVPYEKIADEYGVSPSTVKKRVRGLKMEGYIPEGHDGRRRGAKSTSAGQRVVGNNKCGKCENCESKCKAFYVIKALAGSKVSLVVGKTSYVCS